MIFSNIYLMPIAFIIAPTFLLCTLELNINNKRQVVCAIGGGKEWFVNLTPPEPRELAAFLLINNDGCRAINIALDFVSLNPSSSLRLTYTNSSEQTCMALISRTQYGYIYKSIDQK